MCVVAPVKDYERLMDELTKTEDQSQVLHNEGIAGRPIPCEESFPDCNGFCWSGVKCKKSPGGCYCGGSTSK